MAGVSVHLMFTGRAEEAMRYYVSLIPNSQIHSITRFGVGEPGTEGTVKHAVFSLNGAEFRCLDSFVQHDFTFTPATSIFVTLDSEHEIDAIFNSLAEGGIVLMALAAYPFSKKFGWLKDRFGVSWQLTLNT